MYEKDVLIGQMKKANLSDGELDDINPYVVKHTKLKNLDFSEA